MAPKKDPKKSIAKYESLCSGIVVKAETLVGSNPNGLTDRGKTRAEGYIKELEDQYGRMTKRWHEEFEVQLEDEDEDLHDELFAKITATGIKVDKIKDTLYDLMDKDLASNEDIASETRSLKMETSFKPQILAASSNLEEFNAWERSFLAHHDQNKRFLAASTPKIKQIFFTSNLDSKLQATMATDITITEATPIFSNNADENTLLSWLKKHILRHSPLFIRRFEYSECKQKPKEPFGDWWTRKQVKAKECDLDKVTPESIQITELICGISDKKLREEILRMKDPKLEDLVALGNRYDTASKVQKSNFNEEASMNKVSDYKKARNDKMDKARDSRSNKCHSCGKTPCKSGPGKPCWAKEKSCNNCGKKGHIKPACFSKGDETLKRSLSKTVAESKTVKIKRVIVKKVIEDDCEPTPTCKMDFETEKGHKFSKEVLPDTGCAQTIIAKDLVDSKCMEVDQNLKKKIVNASDEQMACEGTVSFGVKFEGVETDVAALVSSDLQDEILIGWRTLQRLGIISQNFPHVAKVCKALNDSNVPDSRTKIEDLMSEFPSVFEEPGGINGGQLKPMKGDQMTIHLKPGPMKPTHIYTARKCPYAFEGHAKAELDKSVAMGIIEKVEGASNWCSPMSFVRKPGGGCRVVVDLKGLNDHVSRPTHPFPAVKDIIATVPWGSMKFAVFDCKSGYWQIVLDEKSRPLTTFLTEFGRYRYLRAPMGLNSSGDEFCRRTDEAMEGLEGVKKLVDDVLVFAPDDETLLKRIKKVFQRCQEWRITLTKTKFQYGSSVKFAGFIVDETGVRPDPNKVASIKDFPCPKDTTNLKSFMGLVNQFSSYAPDLKHAMVPLQPLLKKANVYQWEPEHQSAFEKVKELLTKEGGPVLARFNPELPSVLITDASRTGLGFILTQDDDLGHARLITCGSRFLSPAENNYAVIELECMAIQWAIIKCRNYLLGVNFIVKTDHKPLLGVINGKDLDAVNNARLQRILSKLLGFQFNVEYVPGKLNLIADALSRYPVFQPDAEEVKDVLVQAFRVNVESNDPQLKEIKEAAKNCHEYQQVVEAIRSKEELNALPIDHPARKYKYFWKEMAFETELNLLSIHDRIVVPKEARKVVLQNLHMQHTGILKTWKNARQLYYWPGMKNDITQVVNNCQDCVAHLPSLPKEPCQQTEAMRPFEAVSIDLGILDGNYYLILADRFSGWPMVAKLNRLETIAITNVLDDWFVDIGKPLRLRADNGPQFRTEFNEWCEKMNIIRESSSPDHHESNGHAESTVKQMKYLLAKTGTWRNFRKALVEWRNTPRCSDDLSPAQWALGRRQRSSCPALPSAYDRLTDQDFSKALARREEMMAKVKNDFDKDRRSLSILSVDTLVVLQNFKTRRWERRGIIVEKKHGRNTYVVDVNGRRFVRNRRFLRPCLHQPDPEVDEVDDENTELFVARKSERISKQKAK